MENLREVIIITFDKEGHPVETVSQSKDVIIFLEIILDKLS